MIITWIKIVIFALSMNTAVGFDGERGRVPLYIGATVYRISEHHNVDPLEVGAFLLAEHRGRDYDPLLTGRHGGGGEAGLFQLMPVWGREVNERCNASERKKHHEYRGMGDCLFIGPGDRVAYKLKGIRSPDRIKYRLPDRSTTSVKASDPKKHIKASKALGWKVLDHRAGILNTEELTGREQRRGRKPGLSNKDLFMSEVNIEAAVVAFRYMKRKHKTKHPHVPDWRLLYRCSSSVRSLYKLRETLKRDLRAPAKGVIRRCENSGRRVTRWEADLRARHSELEQVIFGE